MKRLFLLIVLLIFCLDSYSQNTKKVNVSGWRKMNDNKLRVEFYVLNGNESEVYELTVNFYDNNKTKLLAFAISGDFPKITGGAYKTLYWDVLKDRQDFPDISDVKIYIKSVEVKKATTVTSTYQKPIEANTNKVEQKPQNKPSNTNNAAREQQTDNTKPHESGYVKPQNISKEKRKIFTIGVYGGYGIGFTNEFDAGVNGNYDESKGGERYYGGFLSVGHFAIDVSKTDRHLLFFGDAKYPTSDINSINASIDFYSDIPASPKHDIGILLGFGVGSYTTIYTDELGIESVLRGNEITYFPKAGIVIPLGKHLKFSLIDTYHLTITPMNDFILVFSLNL